MSWYFLMVWWALTPGVPVVVGPFMSAAVCEKTLREVTGNDHRWSVLATCWQGHV